MTDTCRGCGTPLPTRKPRDPRICRKCRSSSLGLKPLPPKARPISRAYDHPKSTKTNRKLRGALERSGTRKATWEQIWHAEIGELGVVRSLRDRPPDWLLRKLKESVGDFAPDRAEGFPKTIRWKIVAGSGLSSLQDHDLIIDEDDLRLRFPKQPTGADIPGIRSTAAADYEVRSQAPRHSDWRPTNGGGECPEIPDFLRRA